MKILAIIPARGGSKRIERKNVKPFAGVPIIAYSIRAAVESGIFAEVMVSTDDEEIALTARRYGAAVPFMRSAATADDYATTADVLREVLARYRSEGREFDALACIYATSPFVTPARLRQAADILSAGNAKAAFTCVQYSYPVQRCLVINENHRIGMLYPEYATARSQDLRPTYHDAGQFYFSTVEEFEKTGSLWGADTMPIILPETEVQDLDTLTDWKIAEMKFALLRLPRRIETAHYSLVAYPDLEAGHSELMRRGRNLDSIRIQMVNREEISEESHREFVESLRFRHDKQYYTVYERHGDEKPIGSVTLDELGGGRMERGIWLFPEHQGLGHAKRLMHELYDFLAEERNVTTIDTMVRRENAASLALELSLGSRLKRRDDQYVYFTLPLR